MMIPPSVILYYNIILYIIYDIIHHYLYVIYSLYYIIYYILYYIWWSPLSVNSIMLYLLPGISFIRMFMGSWFTPPPAEYLNLLFIHFVYSRFVCIYIYIYVYRVYYIIHMNTLFSHGLTSAEATLGRGDLSVFVPWGALQGSMNLWFLIGGGSPRVPTGRVCVYIYIYIERERERERDLYTYAYTGVYTYIYIYIYVDIYTNGTSPQGHVCASLAWSEVCPDLCNADAYSFDVQCHAASMAYLVLQ